MTGKIFNIQRFSTSDGPGIRTVVFLKGCPLSCAWCHNPESRELKTEIFYNSEKCVSCEMCQNTCIYNNHMFKDDKHFFFRNNCNLCMQCVDKCPSKALEICGVDRTADEVVHVILRDKDFYEQSGGGVTLSGGEPLMQYDFSLGILKKAKENGIHTAIETSGYSSCDLKEMSKYVNLWLYDIKLISESEHIKYTGVSNEIIFKNLQFLDSMGAKIILRCPIIPNVNLNEKHFMEIANIANTLKNIVAIHFEPYHPLGINKAIQLGKTQAYENEKFLTSNEILYFVDCIRDRVNVNIEIL